LDGDLGFAQQQQPSQQMKSTGAHAWKTTSLTPQSQTQMYQQHSPTTLSTLNANLQQATLQSNTLINANAHANALLLQRMDQLLELNTLVWNRLKEPNMLSATVGSHGIAHHQNFSASSASDQYLATSLDTTTLVPNRQRGQSDEIAATLQLQQHPAQRSLSATSSFMADKTLGGLTNVPPVGSSVGVVASAVAGSAGTSSSGSDKDKSFGKLSYFCGELKKEIENAHKQKKESQLEMQLLREKYNSLEEKLAVDGAKISSLEDKLEKTKLLNKQLQQQNDHFQTIVESQNALIAQLQMQVQQQSAAGQLAPLHPVVAQQAINQQSQQSQGYPHQISSSPKPEASLLATPFAAAPQISSVPNMHAVDVPLTSANMGFGSSSNMLSSNASILSDSFPIFNSLSSSHGGTQPASSNSPVPTKPSGPISSSTSAGSVFHQQTLRQPVQPLATSATGSATILPQSANSQSSSTHSASLQQPPTTSISAATSTVGDGSLKSGEVRPAQAAATKS
jgi:hypothetical protein